MITSTHRLLFGGAGKTKEGRPCRGAIGQLAIPARACQEIESLLGAAVVRVLTPPDGHSAQLAARLELADGRRVFAKSVPDSSPLATNNNCTQPTADGSLRKIG